MLIITRKEAAEREEKYYYTGKPCRQGHTAQRYVKGFDCCQCCAERALLYRVGNKEKIAANNKLYREEHKEKAAEYSKQYYVDNKENLTASNKMYRIANKDVIINKNKNKNYRETHKEERSIYQKTRYDSDVQYRLATLIRSRLTRALKRRSKKGSAVKLLGCSISELVTHFESLFTEGMNWSNQGEWHIDHVIPLAYYDLENEEDLAKVCHYSNLQPLWALDNIVKGDKLPEAKILATAEYKVTK